MGSTVAVIGGGPAGLMAAEVLATAGLPVTVFERMPTVGRKLQVAGRGGLNLTHSEPLGPFVERYAEAAPFLGPMVERFDPSALRAWSEALGQPTVVGSSGRVFPDGFRATALLRAWLRRLDRLGVEIRTRHAWRGWHGDALAFTDGDGADLDVPAIVTVLAMGGASWPRTGSDGAWVGPLEAAGVAVQPLRPANCGVDVAWTDGFVDAAAGAPLKDVVVRHRDRRARGDVVVTRHGLEGGPIYALTASIRTALDADGTTDLSIDLLPDATLQSVTARLARRRPKDSTSTGLRRAGLAPVAIGLLREATGNQVPSEPHQLLRAVPVRITGTRPIERAISSAGGVGLDQVDDTLMLRTRPGTFVAGEMLDWEAPTGGYLLQGAFSTGVAAAEGALAWLATVPS